MSPPAENTTDPRGQIPPPSAQRKRTILVVDDEEDLREVLTDLLKSSGFEVAGAATGQEALDRIGGVRPDLVILDLMLPDTSGFEVCKKIKTQNKGYLPIIILTARGDMDSLVSSLGEALADDYVVKPFHPQELLARIGAWLRVKDLHDVIQGQNDLLTELSITDDLTGLHNRRYLTRKLEERIQLLRQNAGILSCALMDLDDFKRINDMQGHLAGDEVLRQFGQILKNTLTARPGMSGDISGRWGGDEFLVIFSDTSDDERIKTWAASVQSRIEKIQVVGHRGPAARADRHAVYRLGVSIGAASVRGPDLDLDAVQLVSDLDALLYQAKQNNNGRLAVAKFDSVGRIQRARKPDKPAGRKPVIFVLDDDPDICAVIGDMLSRHNFDTKIFQETDKMLSACEPLPPDLVLLDLKLSDGEGTDVCRQLKKRPQLAETKICFMTAFSSDDVKVKVRECGADDFLIKPFSYAKFVERVNHLLAAAG